MKEWRNAEGMLPIMRNCATISLAKNARAIAHPKARSAYFIAAGAAIPVRLSGSRSILLMKKCPWHDLHLHWSAFEADVSALDYTGLKSGAPGWIRTNTGPGLRRLPLLDWATGARRRVPMAEPSEARQPL